MLETIAAPPFAHSFILALFTLSSTGIGSYHNLAINLC